MSKMEPERECLKQPSEDDIELDDVRIKVNKKVPIGKIICNVLSSLCKRKDYIDIEIDVDDDDL